MDFVFLLIRSTPITLPGLPRTEDDEKRDTVDIQIVLPTYPTTTDDKEDFFRNLMQYMDKPEEDDLQEMIVFDHHHDVIVQDHGNPTWEQCERCLEEDMNMASNLEPAYPCDGWDHNSKICFLDRNIGDTVTFKLKIPVEKKSRVTWRLEFNSENKGGMRAFLIPKEKPLWNIVIGSLGYEFRISPVTELDVDSNAFSATLEEPSGTNNDKIYFKIRPVPIDLGFVYPGETLVLNMASYIALPLDSLRYSWFLEAGGEQRPLPSNMRESPSGGALAVDELRAEQGGVIICAVHSNRGLQVARKRFLVGNMKANPALTSSNHNSFRRRSSDFHQPLQRHTRKIKIEEQLEKGIEVEENSTSDDEDEGFEYETPDEGKDVYDSLKELPQSQLGDPSRQLPPPTFKNIENRKPGNEDSWSAQNPYNEEPSENKETSNKYLSNAQEPNFKQPFENKNPELKVSSSAQESPSYYKPVFENKKTENKVSPSVQEPSSYYKPPFEDKKPDNKVSSSAQEPSLIYKPPSEDKKSENKVSSSAQEPSSYYKPMFEGKKPENKVPSSIQEPSVDNKELFDNKIADNKYSSSAQKPSLYSKEPFDNKKPDNKYLSSAQEPSSDYEDKPPKKPSNPIKTDFSQVSPSRKGMFDTSGQSSTELKGSKILSNTFDGGHESLLGKTIVLSTEDRLSKFIAECSTERQCSGQATCVRDEGSPGFCRCRSGYRGNGISCWESFNSRE